MIIILTGVSGSGKTTIGRLLAENLGWSFYEGDDFHPQVNIEKMRQGIPLNDDDRKPWLRNLRQLIDELVLKKEMAIVACSALKSSYREMLAGNNKDVKFVFLKGDYQLIEERLNNRSGHFFGANLLKSQFEVMEEPEFGLTVDISQEPNAIVDEIMKGIGLRETNLYP